MAFKIKIIEFCALIVGGMFWYFIGFALVNGDYIPTSALFYALGIIGGFLLSEMLQAIEDRRKNGK